MGTPPSRRICHEARPGSVSWHHTTELATRGSAQTAMWKNGDSLLTRYDGCRKITTSTTSAVRRKEPTVPKEPPSLGELEIRVLRLVWRRQPCTERQISDLIQQERSVGRTTVLKTMQRLETKGLLVRADSSKGPVRFRAAVDEENLLPKLIRRFVERTLGGSPGPLVAYLADSERLSSKDLDALRRIARKVAEHDEDE